jgi:hypothetical protein
MSSSRYFEPLRHRDFTLLWVRPGDLATRGRRWTLVPRELRPGRHRPGADRSRARNQRRCRDRCQRSLALADRGAIRHAGPGLPCSLACTDARTTSPGQARGAGAAIPRTTEPMRPIAAPPRRRVRASGTASGTAVVALLESAHGVLGAAGGSRRVPARGIWRNRLERQRAHVEERGPLTASRAKAHGRS